MGVKFVIRWISGYFDTGYPATLTPDTPTTSKTKFRIISGKSKVFLRSCVHEPLEERRRNVLRRSATLIQKMWRGLRQWRRYRTIRQAAKRIQV